MLPKDVLHIGPLRYRKRQKHLRGVFEYHLSLSMKFMQCQECWRSLSIRHVDVD